MIADTQYKLEEAEFFLGLMKQNRGKFNKFNFYLSAFSSAARSVLHVMEREYKRTVPGWTAWSRKKEDDRTDEEKALKDLFINMRDTAVHEGRLNARALYKVKFSKEDEHRLKTNPPIGRLLFSLNGRMENSSLQVLNEKGERTIFPFLKVTQLRRHVKECPDKDILEVCQRSYNFLAAHVKECTEKFGVPLKS